MSSYVKIGRNGFKTENGKVIIFKMRETFFSLTVYLTKVTKKVIRKVSSLKENT